MSNHHRPVLIDTGRSPFEVMLLAAAVLTGTVRLFGAPRPPSVAALLPPILTLAWYALLTVGGAVGLAGAFWRDPITGLLIERAGMLLLGPAALIYAIAVVAFGGVNTFTVSFITGAFGVACLVRAAQISRDLRRLGE